MSNPQEFAATSFSIKTDATMFSVFSKSIYSDIILAPLRELCTNAIDACIESSLPVKFDVHLPTHSNSTFSVRDYGAGLPLAFLNGDFCVVGASSKRDSNRTTGSFGMGRLSPLAYTSSCTVESFIDGQHHSYILILQEGIPTLLHLSSAQSDEPTGARFSFPIDPLDITKFHTAAVKLFKYFEYQPTLNIELPPPTIHLNHDNFMLTDDDLGILMGNIYYPIDRYKVQSSYANLILKCPIGSCSLTPGRESLNYDDTTITYLKDYIAEAESELLAISNTEIASQPTPFAALKSYAAIHQKSPSITRKALVLQHNHPHLAVTKEDCPIASPLFEIRNKISYYKTLRSPSACYRSIQHYVRHPYFLADTRNWADALRTLDYENAVVIIPNKVPPKDYDAHISLIKTTLDNAGFVYTTASSIATTPNTRTPSAIKDLQMRKITSGLHSPTTYRENDGVIHYVPLNGTTLDKYCLSFQHISSIHAQIFPGTTLWGIAKSNLPKVKSNPNFINVIDHLQATFTPENPLQLTHTKHEYYSKYSTYSYDSEARMLKSPKCPEDLRTFLQEMRAFNDCPFTDLTPAEFQSIQDLVPTTFLLPQPTYTGADMCARYPIINEYRLSAELIDRYLHLESLYAAKVPTTS